MTVSFPKVLRKTLRKLEVLS